MIAWQLDKNQRVCFLQTLPAESWHGTASQVGIAFLVTGFGMNARGWRAQNLAWWRSLPIARTLLVLDKKHP
jgi:hypothetical protein